MFLVEVLEDVKSTKEKKTLILSTINNHDEPFAACPSGLIFYHIYICGHT